MNTIIRHIEYLLSRRDCVIMPELGAFLAKYESATITPDAEAITPPRRSFVFNSAIRTDQDQLLSRSIARATGMDQTEAEQMVSDSANAIKNHLYRRGVLKVGHIGSLVRDEHTGQVFLFASDSFASLNSMWLSPVGFKVDKPVAQIEHPVVSEYRNHKRPSRLNRFVRVAASVALLLGIGIVASTPLHIDDVTLASLAPEIKTVESSELLPQVDATTIESMDNAADITSPDISQPTESVTHDASEVLADTHEAPAATEATNVKEYHLIIASFATRQQAEKFVEQREGNHYQIFGKRKLFKVSSASFETKDEALKACAAAQRNYPGAWIYHHK